MATPSFVGGQETSDRARGDVSASPDPVVRKCLPPRALEPYFLGTTISPEMIFAL
jgi:hypothetical protein